MTSEQATFFHPISSPPFIWNIALHLAVVWKLAGNNKKKKCPEKHCGSPIRVLLCRGSKTNELETLSSASHSFRSHPPLPGNTSVWAARAVKLLVFLSWHRAIKRTVGERTMTSSQEAAVLQSRQQVAAAGREWAPREAGRPFGKTEGEKTGTNHCRLFNGY